MLSGNCVHCECALCSALTLIKHINEFFLFVKLKVSHANNRDDEGIVLLKGFTRKLTAEGISMPFISELRWSCLPQCAQSFVRIMNVFVKFTSLFSKTYCFKLLLKQRHSE